MKKLYNLFTNAEFLETFHKWSIVFWLLLTIVSIPLGWIHSTAFISVLSEVALILASWASWQGARAEVAQKESK